MSHHSLAKTMPARAHQGVQRGQSSNDRGFPAISSLPHPPPQPILPISLTKFLPQFGFDRRSG